MIKLQLTISKSREDSGSDTTYRLEANLPETLANEVVALVMQRLALANQRAPVGEERGTL